MTADGAKWNEGRAAGSEPSPTAGVNNILLRALMKMTGRDMEYVKAYLGNKTKEQRAALRKNPRVVQIMAELSAATVVNGVNTDELLEELGMDMPEPVATDVGDGSGIEADLPVPVAVKTPNTRTSKKKLVSITE